MPRCCGSYKLLSCSVVAGCISNPNGQVSFREIGRAWKQNSKNKPRLQWDNYWWQDVHLALYSFNRAILLVGFVSIIVVI
jgi:hypothetical protein